ncbi:hypothetical protein PR048_008065 [Dryococelus australis]|uniref:Uncharacterized protein n=1 Tax=Dryococelus australis TaxID=614101 RepID=A0ABQ9HW13_9NEOP|nr:hypothetical protein PR048_008065 [Dryococelus australis]
MAAGRRATTMNNEHGFKAKHLAGLEKRRAGLPTELGDIISSRHILGVDSRRPFPLSVSLSFSIFRALLEDESIRITDRRKGYLFYLEKLSEHVGWFLANGQCALGGASRAEEARHWVDSQPQAFFSKCTHRRYDPTSGVLPMVMSADMGWTNAYRLRYTGLQPLKEIFPNHGYPVNIFDLNFPKNISYLDSEFCSTLCEPVVKTDMLTTADNFHRSTGTKAINEAQHHEVNALCFCGRAATKKLLRTHINVQLYFETCKQFLGHDTLSGTDGCDTITMREFGSTLGTTHFLSSGPVAKRNFRLSCYTSLFRLQQPLIRNGCEEGGWPGRVRKHQGGGGLKGEARIGHGVFVEQGKAGTEGVRTELHEGSVCYNYHYLLFTTIGFTAGGRVVQCEARQDRRKGAARVNPVSEVVHRGSGMLMRLCCGRRMYIQAGEENGASCVTPPVPSFPLSPTTLPADQWTNPLEPINLQLIEVNIEQRRNERTGETGYPRENPLTNTIVWHDSRMQKSGVGCRTQFCMNDEVRDKDMLFCLLVGVTGGEYEAGARMSSRGKREISEKNPPTNGIVRHDSHLRKSGDPAGDLTRTTVNKMADDSGTQQRLEQVASELRRWWMKKVTRERKVGGRTAYAQELKDDRYHGYRLRTNHECSLSELRNPEWLGQMRKRHDFEVCCGLRFVCVKTLALFVAGAPGFREKISRPVVFHNTLAQTYFRDWMVSVLRVFSDCARITGGVVSWCEVSCIMQTNAVMAFHSNMIQPAGQTLCDNIRGGRGEGRATSREALVRQVTAAGDSETSKPICKGGGGGSPYKNPAVCRPVPCDISVARRELPWPYTANSAIAHVTKIQNGVATSFTNQRSVTHSPAGSPAIGDISQQAAANQTQGPFSEHRTAYQRKVVRPHQMDCHAISSLWNYLLSDILGNMAGFTIARRVRPSVIRPSVSQPGDFQPVFLHGRTVAITKLPCVGPVNSYWEQNEIPYGGVRHGENFRPQGALLFQRDRSQAGGLYPCILRETPYPPATLNIKPHNCAYIGKPYAYIMYDFTLSAQES